MGGKLRVDRARKDGLMFVLLGCAVFLLVGGALENALPVSTVDFRVVYYSARCLLAHQDPYSESQLQKTYRDEGGQTPRDTPSIRLMEKQYIYFPSAFPFTIPFALLPFGPAHFLWLGFTAASLIVAAILIWNVASSFAPILSGFLIGLLIADAELFLAIGNPGGIAIGLCAIGVWCFIRERWVVAGILCMAVSLMLKPHNAGLVWLLFLLAGGTYRKRALQALMVIAILCLPVVLWITSISSNWPKELGANLLGNSARGSLSDPGPHSSAGHGIGMMINLQTVISVFRDDPKTYNPIAYAIVAMLLLIWVVKTVRTQLSVSGLWFALAPISAIAMLPVYHRLYDAKIILVAIPASAMLWKRGGAIAWASSLMSAAAVFLTGGLPWAVLLRVLSNLSLSNTPATVATLIWLQVLPVPLTLLSFGLLFLFVYLKNGLGATDAIEHRAQKQDL
jgi:hypothetical protein